MTVKLIPTESKSKADVKNVLRILVGPKLHEGKTCFRYVQKRTNSSMLMQGLKSIIDMIDEIMSSNLANVDS